MKNFIKKAMVLLLSLCVLFSCSVLTVGCGAKEEPKLTENDWNDAFRIEHSSQENYNDYISAFFKGGFNYTVSFDTQDGEQSKHFYFLPSSSSYLGEKVYLKYYLGNYVFVNASGDMDRCKLNVADSTYPNASIPEPVLPEEDLPVSDLFPFTDIMANKFSLFNFGFFKITVYKYAKRKVTLRKF